MVCSLRGGVVADRRATAEAQAPDQEAPASEPEQDGDHEPVPSTVVRREIGMPRTRIGGTALSAFVPQRASAAPTHPPHKASRTLSVKSSRPMCQGLAPSARRTAISWRRVLARARTRFAVLPHTASRSNSVIAWRMASDAASRRCGPRGASQKDRILARMPVLVWGNATANSRMAASSSDCAAARVAPGASRPSMASSRLPRSSISREPLKSSGASGREATCRTSGASRCPENRVARRR